MSIFEIVKQRGLVTLLSRVLDECIEWQVNYGYQKFHKFLIKI